MELSTELGLARDVIGSNDHLRKTYVWKRGRLVALPDGLMMMVPTKVLPVIGSSLLSWPTKLRMGLEVLRSPKAGTGDRSVSQFVAEHYGREAVDYLAEPLLAGIYGGDPEQLSATSVLPRLTELESRYGSLSRGVVAERRKAASNAGQPPLFRTLKGGLGTLVESLESAVGRGVEFLRCRAETIERTENGFRIHAGGDWLSCRSLVMACEAHNAAPLVLGLDAGLAQLLEGIPYNSSIILALAFPSGAFRSVPDGFGFLVPRRERRRLVACTWVNTKFSYRAPEGIILLRCFLGGTGDDDILTESDDTVVEWALADLRGMIEIHGQPLFSRVFRWPRAMAQYTVGHAQRVAEIESRLRQIPGLHVAGNAYYGIGVPDCIRMGRQAAQRIAAEPI
jgi:oxygen-dependent protoporphyrinogen oxidase